METALIVMVSCNSSRHKGSDKQLPYGSWSLWYLCHETLLALCNSPSWEKPLWPFGTMYHSLSCSQAWWWQAASLQGPSTTFSMANVLAHSSIWTCLASLSLFHLSPRETAPSSWRSVKGCYIVVEVSVMSDSKWHGIGYGIGVHVGC